MNGLPANLFMIKRVQRWQECGGMVESKLSLWVLGIFFWLGGNSVVSKKQNFPAKLHQHRAACKVNYLGMGGIFCLGRGAFLFLFCFIFFCPFVNMWMFWVKHPKIWDFMSLSQTKTDQTRLNQDFFFSTQNKKSWTAQSTEAVGRKIAPLAPCR